MDFEVKQAVAWAIVLTGMRKAADPEYLLTLIDQKTGKRVGRYSTAFMKLEMD